MPFAALPFPLAFLNMPSCCLLIVHYSSLKHFRHDKRRYTHTHHSVIVLVKRAPYHSQYVQSIYMHRNCPGLFGVAFGPDIILHGENTEAVYHAMRETIPLTGLSHRASTPRRCSHTRMCYFWCLIKCPTIGTQWKMYTE